jgi:hypothetical protein
MVEALVRAAPGVAVDWDRVLRAAAQQRALPVPVSKGAPTLEQLIARAALITPGAERDPR